MAIKSEDITINGRDFVRTYSDAGRLIERDGMKYSEAIDPAEFAAERVYTETDERVPVEEPTEAEYATAARIMFGVE